MSAFRFTIKDLLLTTLFFSTAAATAGWLSRSPTLGLGEIFMIVIFVATLYLGLCEIFGYTMRSLIVSLWIVLVLIFVSLILPTTH